MVIDQRKEDKEMKHLKKSKVGVTLLGILAAIVLLVPAIGCRNFPIIVGSGPVTTQDFQLSGFNEVQISSAFGAEIQPSSEYSVSVTASENLFQYMDIRKDGNTLIVAMKPGISWNTGRPMANITMPELRSINLSGAVKATTGNFNSTNPLRIGVSGASSLDVGSFTAGDTSVDVSGASRVSGELQAANTQFEVSGASTVELAGTSTRGTMNVSGGSRLRMSNFTVNEAAVEASGASRAELTVNYKLDIELSGASALDYYGNPAIGKISTTGASSLNHKQATLPNVPVSFTALLKIK